MLEIKIKGGVKVKILSLILLINTALTVGTIINLRIKSKKLEGQLNEFVSVQSQVWNKLSCFEDNVLDSLWDVKHDLENKDKKSIELNKEVLNSLKNEAATLYFKLLFPPFRSYRRNG
jgi:hypothetical protein